MTELLVGVRGELNDRRRAMVRLAFNCLDTDRSGVVTVDEMMANYNFKAHPDVVAGKKTVQEAAREFMRTWDRKDSDGLVSYEEFEDYYKELSASIDGDDYFELMIRNAWRIAGGTGMAANTANRRVLVTNKDGSQSVQTIE
ncbi:EF-hand domain-containing protein, partial [archaeon]